jgi:DNA-binding response OmpR family regulator
MHNDNERGIDPRSGSLAGHCILVVEDEALIAMEVAAALGDDGAAVLGPASTVLAALQYAKSGTMSAAVLDVRLGRESIAPVAKMLASRGIPFLFYSGQLATDPVRLYWPDVAAIQKPAPSHRLIEAVARLVGPHPGHGDVSAQG